MAHAQNPDSFFQRNGRVRLYGRGCQLNRVLAFLECGSEENDCSNTGWTVPSQTEDCLATHSIRFFPLHFSSRASPCATRFRFSLPRLNNDHFLSNPLVFILHKPPSMSKALSNTAQEMWTEQVPYNTLKQLRGKKAICYVLSTQ